MSVYWHECVNCKVRYLPSVTSHPTECGICAPMKNKKAVAKKRGGKSWRDDYDGKLPVMLLEEDFK